MFELTPFDLGTLIGEDDDHSDKKSNTVLGSAASDGYRSETSMGRASDRRPAD
jgi:hypothetical protein